MNKFLLLLQLGLLLLLAPAPAPAQDRAPKHPPRSWYEDGDVYSYEYYDLPGRSLGSVGHAPPAAHSQPKTKHYLVGFLLTSFSK